MPCCVTQAGSKLTTQPQTHDDPAFSPEGWSREPTPCSLASAPLSWPHGSSEKGWSHRIGCSSVSVTGRLSALTSATSSLPTRPPSYTRRTTIFRTHAHGHSFQPASSQAFSARTFKQLPVFQHLAQTMAKGHRVLYLTQISLAESAAGSDLLRQTLTILTAGRDIRQTSRNSSVTCIYWKKYI